MLVVAALLLSGCGTGSEVKRPSNESPKVSDRSHPFSVGEVPAGFEVVTAGAGTREPDWFGGDATVATRHFTVLAPPSTEAGGLRGAAVFAMGFQEDVEGLGGLGPSYSGIGVQTLSIDGQPAQYSASGSGGRPKGTALAVRRGTDTALVVEGDHATRQELIAIAQATETPKDHRQAPTVADPPLGLRVVGSVDADAALAFDAYLFPGSGKRPGAASAHVVGWQRGSIDLVAMSLPGTSLDLDALAARPDALGYGPRRSVERRTIRGRSALVIDERGDDGSGTFVVQRRSVLAEASNGDVLLATAASGVAGNPERTEPPSAEELMAVVATMEPSTEAQWEALVTKTDGGPGLHPDAGQVEVASGERNGVGWLLQDGPGPATTGMFGSSRGPGGEVTAPDIGGCLKLDNGDRPCPNVSSGGVFAPVMYLSSTRASAVGPFVVVETDVSGDKVRIESSTGTIEAPLHRGADTERRAAVLFPEVSGLPPLTCTSPAPPRTWLVSVVATDGTTTCLGPPN